MITDSDAGLCNCSKVYALRLSHRTAGAARPVRRSFEGKHPGVQGATKDENIAR